MRRNEIQTKFISVASSSYPSFFVGFRGLKKAASELWRDLLM